MKYIAFLVFFLFLLTLSFKPVNGHSARVRRERERERDDTCYFYDRLLKARYFSSAPVHMNREENSLNK